MSGSCPPSIEFTASYTAPCTIAMCSTATFGGWPAAPNAAKALAFHVRTMPAFGGVCAVAGVFAIGVITPTSATVDAAMKCSESHGGAPRSCAVAIPLLRLCYGDEAASRTHPYPMRSTYPHGDG